MNSNRFYKYYLRACAVALALVLAACSAGPPPAQIAEARTALQEAQRVRADELAAREYDTAVRHLSVAESTWKERQDAPTAAHWARRAEAAAREAQFQAEARTAEQEIRLQTERRSRAELAVRDAEIARLHSEARTDAERRAAEAQEQAAQSERMAREERRRMQEERDRRQEASEQARLEAEARRAAEDRAREAEREADQVAREAEARAAEERRRLRLEAEDQQRRADEEARARSSAEAAEITRLREEQERTRAELRETLSRLGQVREEARGLVLTLPGSVYFEVNKSVVQSGMRSRLTEIARALETAGEDSAILIEGHTDSDGSNEYNLELLPPAGGGGALDPGRRGRPGQPHRDPGLWRDAAGGVEHLLHGQGPEPPRGDRPAGLGRREALRPGQCPEKGAARPPRHLPSWNPTGPASSSVEHGAVSFFAR